MTTSISTLWSLNHATPNGDSCQSTPFKEGLQYVRVMNIEYVLLYVARNGKIDDLEKERRVSGEKNTKRNGSCAANLDKVYTLNRRNPR